MSFTKTQQFVFAALIFGAVSADSQEYLLADEQELLELLVKHQNSQFPDDKRFANEPLDCIFYQNATIDHVISSESGDPIFVFTSVRTDLAGYFLYPNILSLDSVGNWIRTPIPTSGDGWTHIHRSNDGAKVLIAMDNVPESSGWETRFVLSEDSGNSWRYVSKIKKYVYFDVIRYFTLSESGEGTAVEYYDGDVGGYDDAGYYIFRTKDWGRNWSDREYRTEYDPSGLVDVVDGLKKRRANRRSLGELFLPNFGDCLTSE